MIHCAALAWWATREECALCILPLMLSLS